MLLNLSNHPSKLWPEEQKQTAIDQYKTVQDLPFPQIDPEMDDYKLDLLVEDHLNKIQEINPNTVHVMGEMTFTYKLVSRLKDIGIKCVASTTERIAQEDGEGNKTSSFKFVQFREY